MPPTTARARSLRFNLEEWRNSKGTILSGEDLRCVLRHVLPFWTMNFDSGRSAYLADLSFKYKTEANDVLKTEGRDYCYKEIYSGIFNQSALQPMSALTFDYAVGLDSSTALNFSRTFPTEFDVEFGEDFIVLQTDSSQTLVSESMPSRLSKSVYSNGLDYFAVFTQVTLKNTHFQLNEPSNISVPLRQSGFKFAQASLGYFKPARNYCQSAPKLCDYA
ncbi:hypothetical protein K438DRAFT_1764333 [Mycena galopus ATCC 62051]|nr:hypothetical protein K438DRAFT_1764333 [Mycena galopus ATCC 62051]